MQNSSEYSPRSVLQPRNMIGQPFQIPAEQVMHQIQDNTLGINSTITYNRPGSYVQYPSQVVQMTTYPNNAYTTHTTNRYLVGQPTLQINGSTIEESQRHGRVNPYEIRQPRFNNVDAQFDGPRNASNFPESMGRYKPKKLTQIAYDSPRFAHEETLNMIVPGMTRQQNTSSVMMNGVPVQMKSIVLQSQPSQLKNQVSFQPTESERPFQRNEPNREMTLVSVMSQRTQIVQKPDYAKHKWLMKYCPCCYEENGCCCLNENMCCSCWQECCSNCSTMCQCQQGCLKDLCDCKSLFWSKCFNWRAQCFTMCLSCENCQTCCYGGRCCTMKCCVESQCYQSCCQAQCRCCDSLCDNRCCQCCYDSSNTQCSSCAKCCGNDCQCCVNCLRGNCNLLETCCQDNCKCLRPICKRECCECRCCDCECCDTGACLWCKQKCCLICW